MNNKNIFFKKYTFLLLIIAIFCSAIFSFVGVKQKQNECSAVDDYTLQIEEIAKSLKFNNCTLESLYSPDGEVATIYNFVSVVRFKDEADTLYEINTGTGKTNYETMQDMYNAEDKFSVKKYYEVVSNGRLNLESVFILGPDNGSLELPLARSECVDKNSNDGVGYDPDATLLGYIPVRYVLEYKLLNAICDNAVELIRDNYNLTCDSNGDNEIDSLSISMLPDPVGYIVDWSDLLWAHSAPIQTGIISMAGASQGIYIANFRFTDSESNTIYFGNYMINDLETSINSATGMPKNNTDIHELGHVLGFPDYYVYDSDFDNSVSDGGTEAVCFWDIMAYNHLSLPQYPLTYNREKQNWIDDVNIKQIDRNGDYKIQPVNYEEVNGTELGDRTVAYKLVSEEYPDQAIYLEYRKQTSGSFENNSSYCKDGLLVYRVDEGFTAASGYGGMLSTGNFAATPYNVYVFRNDLLNTTTAYMENIYAPLNMQNKSMGDDKTYSVGLYNTTARDITWQVYEGGKSQSSYALSDVTEVDSGIVISIVSIDETTGELTFNVNWDELPTGSILDKSFFGDEKLYYKLLDIAGKESTDDLSNEDLNGLTALDLYNCSLTSLEGLTLMNMPNLVSIDCSLNNLSDVTEVDETRKIFSNAKFNLSFNNFNLQSLSSTLKGSRFIWGYQNVNSLNNSVIFATDNSSYYVDIFSLDYDDVDFDGVVNGSSGSPRVAVGLGETTLSSTMLTSVFTHPISITIKRVKISLSSTEASIERNSAFPTVVFEGMEENLFNIVRNPVTIDTTQVTDSYFTVNWVITYKADTSKTKILTYSFIIVDTTPPVLTPNGYERVEVIRNTQYIMHSPEIIIYDNGINANYPFNANPTSSSVGYWTKKFYRVEGETRTLVSQIDTSQYASYVIVFTAVDPYGNVSEPIEKTVEITAEPISREQIPDENLYDAICELTGKTNVYQNSLLTIENVNLQGKEIRSIVGLDLLSYYSNAKINLAQNYISSFNELNTLLASTSDIMLINLHFNDLTDNVAYSSFAYKNKITLGIQGLFKTRDIANLNDLDNYLFASCYSYGVDSNFSFDGSPYSVPTTGYTEKLPYGKYQFKINYVGNIFPAITFIYECGGMGFENTTQELEVFGALDFTIRYEYFQATSFQIKYILDGTENNFSDLNEISQTLGTKVLKVDYYDGEDLVLEITKTFVVSDTQAPELLLNDPTKTVYYLVQGEEPVIEMNVYDNFDEDVQIIEDTDFEENTCGTFVFNYTAKDLSENVSQKVTVTVYVGNINPKQDVVIEYNTDKEILSMFDFITYPKEDFELEILETYDKTILSEQLVKVKFTHSNSDIVLEKEVTVSVEDNTAPIIYLSQGNNIKQYVKEIFVDPGFSAIDNYDGTITDNVIIEGVVNYNKVGKYILTYTVIDSNTNVSEAVKRTVEVMYLPMKKEYLNIKTSDVTANPEWIVGDEVTFNLNFNEADVRYYNLDSQYEWYIDDELVYTGYEKTFKYKFDKVGQHNVYVKAVNQLKDDNTSKTQGSGYYVMISPKGFIESYGVLIIAGASVLIVMFVIVSLIVRKKRRLY